MANFVKIIQMKETLTRLQTLFIVDNLSLLVFLMVAIIGWSILQFSKNYLDGEQNKVRFIKNIFFTLSSISLLIFSGNLILLWLSWVATSLFLHQLLIHYPERPKAQLAAKKKFILARIGDLFLMISFHLIYNELGTIQIKEIITTLENMNDYSIRLEISGILLVLAAILKSAQIPFQGWLLEVMEAPTPVSALLHAGLINAGPFIIIRFYALLDYSQFAAPLLIIWAATTAFLATIIFTTQSKIKTSLAYSSIAHMGFSLFLASLGLYSASLLHLIAHSFYKAYSFLSSGNTIQKTQEYNANKWSRSFQKMIPVYSRSSFLIILQRILILIAIFFLLETSIKWILHIPQADLRIILYLYAGLFIFYIIKLIGYRTKFIQKSEFLFRLGIHARNGFYLSQIFRNIFKIS